MKPAIGIESVLGKRKDWVEAFGEGRIGVALW